MSFPDPRPTQQPSCPDAERGTEPVYQARPHRHATALMINALHQAGFNLPVTAAIPPTKPSAPPDIQPGIPTSHQLTPGRTTRETLPRPFPGSSISVSIMCFAVRKPHRLPSFSPKHNKTEPVYDGLALIHEHRSRLLHRSSFGPRRSAVPRSLHRQTLGDVGHTPCLALRSPMHRQDQQLDIWRGSPGLQPDTASGLASIKRTEKSRSTLVVFEFEI
jgi:hypothetical protein